MVAAAGLAPNILRGADPLADPVRIGHIGLGVRGGNLVSYTGVHPDITVAAVCDVYKPHLQKGVQRSQNPDVKTYHDYRDLLADPAIEAVVIATPDHWHEKMLIDAVEAGKGVYCEKGWTVSVEAAKRMRTAVRKHGTTMQLGHQGRQLASHEVARRMIEAGELGDVTFVRTGRYFDAVPGAVAYRWYGDYGINERPEPKGVLDNLDWERWLGSAPKIEFDDQRFWNWRCYWDYGTGMAGDLLSHELDFVQCVLRQGIPDSCNCSGINSLWNDGREIPDTWAATYHFKNPARTVQFEGVQNSNRGQTPEFCGREGRIIFNDIGQSANRFEVYPDERAHVESRYEQPKPRFTFAPGREHTRPTLMENFVNGVRTGERTWCNEDEAFIEAVTLLMSVKSFKEQRMVHWDARKEEIV